MIKSYLTWPWIVSAPLLMGAFICAVFFVGTDSPLIAPSILCLLAFAAIAVYPNFKNGWAIPTSNSFAFIMGFWLWLVLSLLWSTTPYVSTMFTIILSILPGFFAVCIMAQKPQEWVTGHALVMWLAIGGFAVWALIQFLFFYDTYGPRIHHPFLDPNSLAGLLNLAVAPSVGLFMAARGRVPVLLTGLALVIFYAALVVTQSRAGFASCAVVVFLLLPFAIWRNPGGFPWQRLLFVAATAVLVPVLANIGGVLDYNLLDGSAAQTAAEAPSLIGDTRSIEDRFYLWQSTWNMIKDHFWFGTGLASFYFYYPRYRLPLDRSDGFFAHMDPLQYWAEMGVMAPLLFYGVLICVLLRTIQAVHRAAPADLAGRMKVMASFCGMLAVTAHAHLNYHLYMPGLLLPLSMLLAYWYMATEQILGDAQYRLVWKPAGWQRKAGIGIFALILLLAGGWMVRTSASTYMLSKVQAIASTGNEAEAMRMLHLAGVVAPGSFGRYQEYEARFRIATLWSNARNMNKEDVRRLYEESMHFLDEAQALNPAFTALWDLRARLNYAVNGILINDGRELAIRELHRVIEANPLAADSRVGLANIYQAQGELRKAAQVLEEGVMWPRQKGRPDLSFLVTLAKLKLQLGDRAAHDHYMAEAQARAKSYGMTIQ